MIPKWFLQSFKVYDPRIRPAGENTTGLPAKHFHQFQHQIIKNTGFPDSTVMILRKDTEIFFRWSVSYICQCVRQKFLQDWRCQNGECEIFVTPWSPFSFQEYSFQITLRQQWNDKRLRFDKILSSKGVGLGDWMKPRYLLLLRDTITSRLCSASADISLFWT